MWTIRYFSETDIDNFMLKDTSHTFIKVTNMEISVEKSITFYKSIIYENRLD